jgi:hypothetical protein
MHVDGCILDCVPFGSLALAVDQGLTSHGGPGFDHAQSTRVQLSHAVCDQNCTQGCRDEMWKAGGVLSLGQMWHAATGGAIMRLTTNPPCTAACMLAVGMICGRRGCLILDEGGTCNRRCHAHHQPTIYDCIAVL